MHSTPNWQHKNVPALYLNNLYIALFSYIYIYIYIHIYIYMYSLYNSMHAWRICTCWYTRQEAFPILRALTKQALLRCKQCAHEMLMTAKGCLSCQASCTEHHHAVLWHAPASDWVCKAFSSAFTVLSLLPFEPFGCCDERLPVGSP